MWLDPTAARAAAREHWADAGTLDDGVLDRLIAAASVSCETYAPVLPAGSVVPDAYLLATIYQARELWEAGQREGDVIGVGDLVIRSRPLTGSVKQLLRPQRGIPGVG